MNYIKILCFSAVITGLGSIVSCGDAKYDTLDTHAYIEEALSSTSQKVTVQATGESFTTLNVHLSNLSSTDNHYKLVTDQSVLDTYNHINGTGYIMLPKDYYTLPETITVKAGQYAADALSIALKAFSQEMMKSGESYALTCKTSIARWKYFTDGKYRNLCYFGRKYYRIFSSNVCWRS